MAWARLLRLSLFPSALADPIAGAAVAGVLWPSAWPGLLVAVAASLCVFHGAMAINDWHDIQEDREAGRKRPLPSGELAPVAAATLGFALLLAGVACAYWASTFHHQGTWSWPVLTGVAVVAAAYNLGLRGPILGPLLLGSCRAGNFLFGAMLVLGDGTTSQAKLVGVACAFYFALVFVVSLLGRYEDGEAEAGEAGLDATVQGLLKRQAVLMIMMPVALGGMRLVTTSPSDLGLSLVCAALGPGLGLYFAKPLWEASMRADWTLGKVEAIMGLCLSRFVPFSIIAVVVTASSSHAFAMAGLLFALAKLGRRLMAIIPPS